MNRTYSGYSSRTQLLALHTPIEKYQNYLFQNQQFFSFNETEIRTFTERVGFSFGLLRNWMGYKKKNQQDPNLLETFIENLISAKVDELSFIFSHHVDFFDDLATGTDPRKKYFKISHEDRQMLIDFNVIIVTSSGKVDWHDTCTKNAYLEWKKINNN